MANDRSFYSVFSLCSERGRFVYEVTGLFGDVLTVEELEYWYVYNIIYKASYFKIETEAMSFEEVLQLIEDAEAKQRAKNAKGINK